MERIGVYFIVIMKLGNEVFEFGLLLRQSLKVIETIKDFYGEIFKLLVSKSEEIEIWIINHNIFHPNFIFLFRKYTTKLPYEFRVKRVCLNLTDG